MTNEEAIKILKAIRVYNCYPISAGKKIKEAIDIAIEALSTDAARGVGRYEIAMQKLREMPKYLNGIKKKQITKISSEAVGRKDTITLNSPITIQAEMIAVVRCKDCRYQEHCYKTVAHNKRHDDFYEYWSEPIEWCSRGKRREP